MEKNLMGLIMAGVAGCMGFVGGTSNAAVLASRIAEMETKLIEQKAINAAVERRMNDRRGFMTCATFSLKQVEQRLKLDPPCKLEVPE